MSLAKCKLLLSSVFNDIEVDPSKLDSDEIVALKEMQQLWVKPPALLKVYQVNRRKVFIHQVFDWVVTYGGIYSSVESCSVALASYFRNNDGHEQLKVALESPEGVEIFKHVYATFQSVSKN